MQKSKPDYCNDLDKVYSKIWGLLSLGLSNRNSQFHIPVFICGEKNASDGRMVVLRSIVVKEKKWLIP